MIKYLFIFDLQYGDSGSQYLWDPDSEDEIFFATDLNDAPENATLFRCLTNAYDALDLIEIGMRYQRLGYESLEIIQKTIPEDITNVNQFMENYARTYLQNISK